MKEYIKHFGERAVRMLAKWVVCFWQTRALNAPWWSILLLLVSVACLRTVISYTGAVAEGKSAASRWSGLIVTM